MSANSLLQRQLHGFFLRSLSLAVGLALLALITAPEPYVRPALAASGDLSNPFASEECTYTGYAYAPLVIQELMKWTRGVSFEGHPAPPKFQSGDARYWPDWVRTFGPQFDSSLDWQGAVNNSPGAGTLVVWQPGSTTTWVENKAKVSWTFVSPGPGHIAYVQSWNPEQKTITIWETGWGTNRAVLHTRNDVTVTSDMTFIHEPKAKSPPPSTEKQQTLTLSFQSHLPFRNITIRTASRFELRIDGQFVISRERPPSQTTVTANHVWVGLSHQHTVEIVWWQQGSEPAPEFSQTWWPNQEVSAAEPDPSSGQALPVTYTYALRPTPGIVGQPVNITVSAASPYGFPISSIDVSANGALIGSIQGATGSVMWDTTHSASGNYVIFFLAHAQGWDGNVSSDSATWTLGAAQSGGSCSDSQIEDFSFAPTSPADIGTAVSIHAKVTANACFRSMRLKIDGNVVYELATPELTYNWDTSGYSAGNHTVRLEVAAQGDNSWSNPSVRETNYSLQSTAIPTSVSCAAPSIQDLSFNPASASAGATVSIHAKATWNNCFRSMRLKIDGNIVYELGAPEFTYNWNTSGYSAGNHTVHLEVAAQGDNSWSNPSARDANYSIQTGSAATPIPCQAPAIEDLSFNPGSVVVGVIVNVHAKATWNNCFRSMRLKIDGNIVYELGAPEFTYNWNTSGYSAGNHTVRLEVAAQGDNSWSNPSVQMANYSLQEGAIPTAVPCTAPPVEDLSFNPSSASAGTAVSVHAKATWNNCFRSMRLKIDGNIVYELGSPEFTYTWDTSSYSVGNHTVRLEVAAQGDNSWSNPTSQDANYSLQSNTPSLSKPSLVNPLNGALLPPGTDITLQWNSVSGAVQYLMEIWGGQYGGTHTTLCGWQSSTSCHIGTMLPGNVLWHVKARDSSGAESPWSDEWNFTPQ